MLLPEVLVCIFDFYGILWVFDMSFFMGWDFWDMGLREWDLLTDLYTMVIHYVCQNIVYWDIDADERFLVIQKRTCRTMTQVREYRAGMKFFFLNNEDVIKSYMGEANLMRLFQVSHTEWPN